MPTDVKEAFKEVAKVAGNLDEKQSEEFITLLESKKRYFTETWS